MPEDSEGLLNGAEGDAGKPPIPVETGAPGQDADAGFNPFGETASAPDSRPTDVYPEETRDEPATSPAEAAAPPTTLGRYELREQLGRGAFGAVYRAHDTLLDRQVAIKVPRQARSQDEIDEFLTEARRLAQLQHPSIVTVHDVGSHQEFCYIVTDLLQGRSLIEMLRERRPPWPEAVRLVATIAEALGHAHSRSMIHRDVKPGNIFITDDGSPVLLDFGLALSDLEEEMIGVQAGTPSYMAPEQVQGRAHRVDGRTDIFALGIVLYELLCGRTPFRAQTVEELFRRIREDEPQPPRQLAPSIPPELERVCLCALAKNMSNRYTTAGDFAAALRSVLEMESASQGPVVAPPALLEPDAEHVEPTSSLRRRMAAHKRHVTIAVFNFELTGADEESSIPDPEYQHDLVLSLADCCANAVEAFGGAIMPSTGQEVVACFGFPVSYENAAERAVRAALEVLHEAGSPSSRLSGQLHSGDEVAVWAAIHSGTAVVEGEGEDEFSLVGDARTVASRMEPLTEAGTITISDETERLLKGQFETESIGKRQLRGVPQPVSLYVVRRATGSQRQLDRSETGELTPLVGRATELAVLRERWEYAADGQGQVVLLIGEAGLGKSRLVQELKHHAAAQDECRLLEWNCSPYRVNSSLHPAIECLQQILEFGPDVSPSERLDRLRQHLEPLGLADAEQLGLFASLLSIPAEGLYARVELSPQRLKERTQEVLLDWIRELSSSEPVLFIVEDLHWIDASSLELLELIVDEVASERILALLTFRTEFEPPWSSKAHQTQVALNRLTRRQVREMIKARIGGEDPSEALVDRIVERTDGIPLFVEEFAKIARESGQNLDEIPVTLQDLLLARLDRMQSDLTVIQLAGVLGREFPYEQLQAVSELDEAALREELSKLVAAEILFQKGRLPKCRFLFKHALLQDAAYQSLLRKPRQEFHQRIAEALEGRFPELASSEPELLAQHFTEAGVTDKAVDYWLAAGKRAQSRCANQEAMSHLQKGLALIETLDESIERDSKELDFQLCLGTVMTTANGWGFPDVESVHLRARELCERIGEGSPLFHVTWGMWAWRLLRDELDLADRLSDEVWTLAEARQDPGYIMEGCFAKVCTAMFRGELEKCLEFGPRGMDLYDEERCRFHATLTGQNSGCTIPAFWGWGSWIAGYPDKAIEIGERGVALGRQLNDPFSHAFSIYHLGCVQQHCRMGAAARTSGEASIKIGQEQGFGIWIALGMLCKGSGLLLEGERLEEGAELVQQGFDAFRGSGAELSLSHYYGVLAEAYRASDRIDDALTAVDDGLTLVERTNERFHEANLHRLRGDLLLARSPDSHSEAAECYQKSIDVARRQGAKSWELRAAMSLSRLWRQTGRGDEARPMLAGVYDWFTEGFNTPDLLEAKALLEEL